MTMKVTEVIVTPFKLGEGEEARTVEVAAGDTPGFVSSLDDVVRIRPGEHGEGAI